MLDAIKNFAPGFELGYTQWTTIPQEHINKFGEATNDTDPFHTDPKWAIKNSPFGGTLLYGFQTMSLLTSMCDEVFNLHGFEMDTSKDLLLNYGFNNLRLPAPVKQSDPIRGKFTVSAIENKGKGKILTLDVVIENKNSDRPALTAQWLCYWQKL